MTVLSVNVNKAAVLRNSRGGEKPSLSGIAQVAIDAGCFGLTVHPRPDLRHIRPDDCLALRDLLAHNNATRKKGRLEFNIEGNPFAPANARYPGLLAIVAECRADQVTLVPDSDQQITSDHGFDLTRDANQLAPLVAQYKALNCRVSVFVDSQCSKAALEAACEMGIDRIEIYTGPFAHDFARGDAVGELNRIAQLTTSAAGFGIGVNAGHDLSQSNLAALLLAAPRIAEVSIGHAIFDEALYCGMHSTIASYLQILRAE